jgi:hypothetical protein
MCKFMSNKFITISKPVQQIEHISTEYSPNRNATGDEMLQKMREIGEHLSQSKSWLSQFESPSFAGQK